MLRCTCPTPAGVHAARKGGCYGRRTFARKERLFLCRSQLQGCTGQAENQVDSHRLSNPWKQEEGGSVPKDPPHNCAQPSHIIPADPNFEKKRNSSALFAREINLVTQPSFDCEQGINSQVQTACNNADAIFPVLGIVSCRNERFSLSRKTHVPLWNAPRISHVRLP